MANNTSTGIYNPSGYGGTNSGGFKAQPINDNNPMANYLQSSENLLSGQGSQSIATGTSTTQGAMSGLAPVLQYLTQLTKGDQADVSQATQPQANQIRDSFAAVRNMISQQPRGGGKAGVLAEAPFKQQQQISDMQQQARTGATNQLGTLSTTLAGLGIDQSQLGVSEDTLALDTALGQRGQNEQERAAMESMIGQLGSAAGGVASAAISAH